MDSQSVTTGEAAMRLGVAPATIQRWVDAGVVLAERTLGGHRRIPIAELRRLIASQRSAKLTGPVADLVDVLLTGQPRAIKDALLAARRSAESWADAADEVASAMAELGRQWEAGLCSVFQEHGASEGLRRAAATLAGEIAPGSGAPCATLFTVAGERHTLGLSLAELVLAEAGWRTYWLGEGPPQEEFDTLIENQKPAMLVVSASHAIPRKMVVSYQDALIKLAKRAPVQVVLGGGGPWSPTRKAHRATRFYELRVIADRLRTRL